MKIRLSILQLETLEAAAAGTLTRSDEAHEHWRLDDGLAVTGTVRNLLHRELITEGKRRTDDRIPALITDIGLSVLADLDSRAPVPHELTPHQRDVLHHAAADTLDYHEPTNRWRTIDGTDVTRAARQLRDRCLIRACSEELNDGLHAVVATADGYVALGALDPKPKGNADHD